jgi:hypothetical protein
MNVVLGFLCNGYKGASAPELAAGFCFFSSGTYSPTE